MSLNQHSLPQKTGSNLKLPVNANTLQNLYKYTPAELIQH